MASIGNSPGVSGPSGGGEISQAPPIPKYIQTLMQTFTGALGLAAKLYDGSESGTAREKALYNFHTKLTKVITEGDWGKESPIQHALLTNYVPEVMESLYQVEPASQIGKATAAEMMGNAMESIGKFLSQMFLTMPAIRTDQGQYAQVIQGALVNINGWVAKGPGYIGRAINDVATVFVTYGGMLSVNLEKEFPQDKQHYEELNNTLKNLLLSGGTFNEPYIDQNAINGLQQLTTDLQAFSKQ